MLFPGPNSVDAVWNKIARATHAGELGEAAKIATKDNSARAQVICIYTHNFTDLEDVKRGRYFFFPKSDFTRVLMRCGRKCY